MLVMQKTSIRAWRKHRKLTIEQLAAEIGMSTSNLSRMERGEVPYNQEHLENIASVLRCRPADLLVELEPAQRLDEVKAARFVRAMNPKHRKTWFSVAESFVPEEVRQEIEEAESAQVQ